jgi:hypothetical protein
MDDTPKIVEIEQIQPQQDSKGIWETAVREQSRDRCSNCGGEDRIRVSLIVPIDAGGKYVVTNGRTLCRPCELAAEAVASGKPGATERRPLNFWVSRKLYDRIQYGLESRRGFPSMGALVRYLMTKYVSDEPRFDDLEQYQDSSADVKINVWVERDSYQTFKILIDKRGMTVTDSVKALIMMYEAEAEPLVLKRSAE